MPLMLSYENIFSMNLILFAVFLTLNKGALWYFILSYDINLFVLGKHLLSFVQPLKLIVICRLVSCSHTPAWIVITVCG